MPRKTAARLDEAARHLRASMRPRPDAAENAPPISNSGFGPSPGFNEAAARCRGKRVIGAATRRLQLVLQ